MLVIAAGSPCRELFEVELAHVFGFSTLNIHTNKRQGMHKLDFKHDVQYQRRGFDVRS